MTRRHTTWLMTEIHIQIDSSQYQTQSKIHDSSQFRISDFNPVIIRLQYSIFIPVALKAAPAIHRSNITWIHRFQPIHSSSLWIQQISSFHQTTNTIQISGSSIFRRAHNRFDPSRVSRNRQGRDTSIVRTVNKNSSLKNKKKKKFFYDHGQKRNRKTNRVKFLTSRTLNPANVIPIQYGERFQPIPINQFQ